MSGARPKPRTATYDDLVALPPCVVGEIVDGELFVSPRPAPPQALAAATLGMDVGGAFQRGLGGPGGWWILDERELHLGDDVLVPDLGGWRRERMPVFLQVPFFSLPADRVCEVLSPSSARLDRILKMRKYARGHSWGQDDAGIDRRRTEDGRREDLQRPLQCPVAVMDEPRATTSIPGTSESSPSPIRLFAPGTEIGTRYEVRSVLGTGGSAVVYGAFDRELKRPVALKVLRADRMTEGVLRRFRREAAVARDAASSRLVRVFDIGHAGESLFLTMELVGGQSLRSRMATGPMPVEEVVFVLAEVLRGLDVLHALGIVHRDVKPANVLLAEDGSVKLADFGLALHLAGDESRATETGGLVGTVEYLSPEQALGRELDGRSDLYAAGVMLYEMLTGALPFHRDSPIATALARLTETAPDPRAARPDVPPWLTAILARLLQAEPARRYPGAADVLRDLEGRVGPKAASGSRRRALTIGGSIAAATAAVVLALWLGPFGADTSPRIRFVAAEGPGGIKALDASDRVLWRRDDVPTTALVALARGPRRGQVAVAAMLGPHTGREFGTEGAELSFLSPRTGAVERRVTLPAPGAGAFPGYGPRFVSSGLESTDLTGNGSEVLLVSMYHRPSSPSYSVLHDPWSGTSRLLFLASGHHWPLGVADVDGDGRRELIVGGIANAFGWSLGLAALGIPSVLENAGEPTWARIAPAMTPDLGPSNPRALLWYVLGPQRRDILGRGLRVPPGQRQLELSLGGADPIRIGMDGFLLGTAATLPAGNRGAARVRAYDDLREARRLADAGVLPEAVATAERAVTSAVAAGDQYLSDWARRVHASMCARSGAIGEAESLFERLLSTSEATADVAFEAGKAFHLRGELERAVAWYERSTGRGGSPDLGRLKWESAEGAVLALVELGAVARAAPFVDRFAAAYGQAFQPESWSAFVAWRGGERPRPDRLEPALEMSLFSYWQAEMKLAAGAEPARLLAQLGRGPAEAGPEGDLFRLLRAELKLRTGTSPADARDEAAAAYRALRRAHGNDIRARANFDLATARFARIARAAGRKDEAAEAETYLAKVWGKPGP